MECKRIALGSSAIALRWECKRFALGVQAHCARSASALRWEYVGSYARAMRAMSLCNMRARTRYAMIIASDGRDATQEMYMCRCVGTRGRCIAGHGRITKPSFPTRSVLVDPATWLSQHSKGERDKPTVHAQCMNVWTLNANICVYIYMYICNECMTYVGSHLRTR